MTDQTEGTTGPSPKTELSLLQSRATKLGIKYHPATGVETLKRKIDEHLNGKPKVPDKPKSKELTDLERKNNKINEQRKAARKLIRVRITNHNPQKQEHRGEIFTVSNSVVGTIKRYVPFGNENGWHVENMILDMIKERKFQTFYTVKDHRGRPIPKSKQRLEFAIEVLNPLTQMELNILKKEQTIANNLDD